MGERICLYPGSFDPVTRGHMDIIARAANIFDQVVVGVLHNPDKRGCFPVEKRVEMLRKACAKLENVRIIAYGGLLAQLTREENIRVVVRGVRGVADLESETMMARINHQLNPDLETIFLPASPENGEISASMVRQLAAFGADLSAYVPSEVLPDILAAFAQS
ncbi:MAG: pantetheine-phosphate adenylyltransferase [Clostridia bacterium]|nr:pantetheine-phosphate adenylyltransferase [Clostridiales bacterium]MBQ2975975.1 pantetheine-phosphate adenylyltransferase [Clostridia bacterium]MBQ6805512.1 pantetheine-phosphate adenylyltransferase [Clostridia bacterium]MDD6683763.1 pantetheine-phosphate adenylyltransferase [Clostridiales bacterium]